MLGLIFQCDSFYFFYIAWINGHVFGFHCQHGADVNAADHTGQTALHWSSVRGAIQVAELLLQEGAKVDAADMYGYQVNLIYMLVFPLWFCFL